MTTTTMITALENVGSLKQKATGMLPKIDARLIQWADWKASGAAYGSGSGYGNPIAALMASGGVMSRSTNPDAGGMPDDIYDTDQAVNRLDEAMQAIVTIHYLNTDLTPLQKMECIGVSKPTYYRRLWKAHHQIQFLIKPKTKPRSRSGLAGRMKSKHVEVCV